MPKCTVCHHPRRQAIDLALLAGDATYEALSGQYGPSISSLFRHKKHLEEKMIQTRQRLKNSQEQGCLLKLNAFLDHVQGAVRTAEADGNVDKVLKGAHVGSRIIHQINQMEVPLELDTVYRLISSPQWTSQDSLLPTDPRIITGIHQALADHAFSLCPDPEPEIIPEATHSSLLETQNLELETPATPPLETLSPELETQTMLQELLANLITASETAPKIRREISAKLPRKSASRKHNNQQNQKDNCCQKNTRKNSRVGRESTRRAAYAQAPPAVKPSCSPPVNFNSELPPETGNQKPETVLTEHESLFDRLRRKWATTAPASKYPCDSENFYAEYLKEKEAAGVPDTPPPDSCPDPPPATANQPPETENPQPETQNVEPETPQSETPPPETPKDLGTPQPLYAPQRILLRPGTRLSHRKHSQVHTRPPLGGRLRQPQKIQRRLLKKSSINRKLKTGRSI